jgi:hypothetical protein
MAAIAVTSAGSGVVCALSRYGKVKDRRVQKANRASIFFMYPCLLDACGKDRRCD